MAEGEIDDGRDEPCPGEAHVMTMRWTRLLFLHWPVAPALLKPHLPSGLEVDLFDGKAWLGVVPFGMEKVRLRFLPPLPGSHAFPELNLRTYVRHRGKPGVWFFSLDAASRLAVRGARFWFGLPYYDAKMSIEEVGRPAPDGSTRWIDYRSVRTHREAPVVQFSARYAPAGPVATSRPRTFERFATSRYRLFARRRGQLLCGEIDHPPWPLQPAAVELEKCTLAAPLGIGLAGAPHACYAESLDVRAWSPRRVDP